MLGVCVLYSKTGIYMETKAWLRGIVCYVVAAVVVLVYGFIGQVTLPMAVAFLALYVA